MQPIGRLKHVIIRGGLNIHAEEIEHLLLQHPAIDAAVVVGLPDPRLGERACACLVLRPPAGFDLAAAQAFLEAAGVAKFKWPEFVEIFEDFPRNPVGKLDRRSISETVRAKLDR